jgi:hypothetical protein
MQEEQKVRVYQIEDYYQETQNTNLDDLIGYWKIISFWSYYTSVLQTDTEYRNYKKLLASNRENGWDPITTSRYIHVSKTQKHDDDIYLIGFLFQSYAGIEENTLDPYHDNKIHYYTDGSKMFLRYAKDTLINSGFRYVRIESPDKIEDLFLQ